ncbi:MAG: RagB/SusD family nutrient uptake outer membrane protein [Mangrovibacterium sp.]
MKSTNIITTIACLTLLLSSCNEYLDTMPDNRTVIDTPNKVKELLVSAYPDASCIAFCEAMSDNAGDKTSSAPLQTLENEQSYYWKDVPSSLQDTPDNYWNACYTAIAAANHALEAIDNSDQPDEYEAYKGEALLARAYNHYMLVSLYADRYNPTTADRVLGIPYVTEPEKEVFVQYTRETLQDSYDLIKKDLEEGLPLIDDNAYDVPKYHFTESAAYGFASRFYLTIGRFAESAACANRVLGTHPATLIRDWVAYYELDYYDLRMLYTNSSESANILLGGAVSLLGRNGPAYRYGMTNDIRDELFNSTNVTGGTLLYKVFGRETTLNIPKYEEHFKLSSINATTGLPFIMAPLITMEEVLFNRAEALVMIGDLEGAVKDVNTFFSKRIKNYDTNLHLVTTSSFEEFYRYLNPDIDPWFETTKKQKIFLKGILDIKRKEFVEEGIRWWDIKRYNMEVTRRDESGKIIDVLRPNDLRRAIQIPSAAVAEGVEANKR